MDRWLPSFVDELEKIAVSRSHSTYGPQARGGRRPIRVAKMIQKDTTYWNNRRAKNVGENGKQPQTIDDDEARQHEHEGYQQYSTTPESGDDKGQHYFSSGA